MQIVDVPRGTRDRVGSLIARIARQWRRTVDRRLQPFGLTEATWLPLIYVARTATPMRQKELAAALNVDGSSIVRLLDELEASGLVERHEEVADRRAKVVVLTMAGRSIIEQVEGVARTVREAALRGLTERELQVATHVLLRVSENLALLVEPDE